MKTYNIMEFAIGMLLPFILLAQGENWIYRYNGPGDSTDEIRSTIYGADGNIYIAGGSIGDSTYYDFIVISLSNTGDTNWVYRYNGPGNSDDIATSVVYGADGNIYAAGGSCGSGTDWDFIVISLTTTGDTNWVYRYNGPENDIDCAYAIDYGADGNIYAAGGSYQTYYNSDLTVISLTTTGNANWIFCYDGPGNSTDIARCIKYYVRSFPHICAAGLSMGDMTYYDGVIIDLSTSGDTNWVYRYNGPGNDPDEILSLDIGADRNIYVAGYSGGMGTSYDFLVISMDTYVWGLPRWIFTYNGQGNGFDIAYSVVYGADSNIYAAGYTYNSAFSADLTVISLKDNGDTNWVYRYNGSGDYNAWASSIIYGADGNIYAAGGSYDTGTLSDITVLSLTTSGNANWVYRYNGPGNGDDEALSIIRDPNGNVYAVGNSYGFGTGLDIIVISLPPDYGVEEENNTVLKTSYGATILSGPLRLPKNKKYKIFDITGRIAMSDRLKPGVYFIQIDNKIIQKIVKIR